MVKENIVLEGENANELQTLLNAANEKYSERIFATQTHVTYHPVENKMRYTAILFLK